MKKKLSLLFVVFAAIAAFAVQAARRAPGDTVTLTWDFSEFTADAADWESYGSPYDYNGLSLVMSYVETKDYVNKSGFHSNGQSATNNRYISYTPEYDGTLTVTFKSNKNSDAPNRTTAIGTKITKNATAETEGVLAIAPASTGTVSADLTAGTTYYVFLAVGAQTITKLQYQYTEPSAAADTELPLVLTFPNNNDTKVSVYTREWTATVDGNVWTLNGFNNNNNNWAYVRCGQKSTAQTATITSPVVNAAVANVVITVNKTANVTSAKLATLLGETVLAEQDITADFVPGDVNVPVSGTAGCSYKLTVKSAAGANGSTEIAKVAIYGEGQYVVKHIANTADTPYTVAEAIELIEAGEALAEQVYVKGIVSQVDKFNETYSSINYWISDDGTTANQLECYSGKGIEGADFASVDDVQVGATVIVTGTLTKYNAIYEFTQSNKLVSYEAPAAATRAWDFTKGADYKNAITISDDLWTDPSAAKGRSYYVPVLNNEEFKATADTKLGLTEGLFFTAASKNILIGFTNNFFMQFTGGVTITVPDCAAGDTIAVEYCTSTKNRDATITSASVEEGVSTLNTPKTAFEMVVKKAGDVALSCNAYSRFYTLAVKPYDESKGAYTAPVTISPASGDIAAALAAATNGIDNVGDITINLTEGAQYTVSAPIETGANLVINGNGATIDASANEGAFVQLSTTPAVEEINSYFRIDNITIKDVTVKGVKNSIFWDNNTKYCVVDLTIDNSIFALATEATKNQAFISFQQGGAKDLTVKNSTVYQTGAEENNYFLRYNNSARLDRYGYDKETETQSISYLNNTFYNVGKKGQWGNYGGIAGQAYSEFHVVGNIWYNSGNGQVARRLLGGRNASTYKTCEFNNNTYWFNDAAETGNTSYDEGTQLTSAPSFRDAENGDFAVLEITEQAAQKTGDTRWGTYFPGTTIWTSEEAQEVDWNNGKSIVIPADAFAEVKVGDVLHIGVENAPADAADSNWSYQIVLQDPTKWTATVESTPLLATSYLKDIVVTGDVLALAKQNGVAIQGTQFSVRKVSVEPKYTGSDNTIWVGEATGNIQINKCHFANANDFTGIAVKDTIRVNMAESAWIGLNYNTTSYAWSDFAAEDIEVLNDWSSPFVNVVVKTARGAEILNSDNGGIFVNNPSTTVTSVEILPYQPQAVDITIAAAELTAAGNDIAAAVAAKAAEVSAERNIVGNITINLTAGNYTVSAPIEAAASLAINGAEGAVIDASANEGAFVQLSTTPDEAIKNGNNYYQLDAEILVKDVTITGVKGRFFYDGGKQYALKAATISNSVIALATTSSVPFIAFNTGGINAVTVENSTIYQTGESNVNYFVQYNNGARHDRLGFEEPTTFTYKNNTFYKVSDKWANGNGMQNYTQYVVENNIWVESSNGNIARYLMFGRLGGNGATATYSKNTYWKDGASVDQGNYDGSGTALITNPKFANVEAGDFTIGAGTEQALKQTGDPRWRVEFVEADAADKDFANIVVTPAAGTDITAAIAEKEKVVNPLNITVNLEAANYTISEALKGYEDIVINGNGATVDASAVSGAFVSFAQAPDFGAAAPRRATLKDEWADLKHTVTIKNLTVNGLAAPVFKNDATGNVRLDINVDNMVAEIAASVIVFDVHGTAAFVENLNINNSTFYAPTATTQSFFSAQSAKNAGDVYDDAKDGTALQTFKFTNSTFYNLATGRNFFTLRQSGQVFLAFNLQKNIFDNCGKTGQTLKGFNQGQASANPQWSVDLNTFMAGGKNQAEADQTGDAEEPATNNLPTDPQFADAANGDFTIGAGTAQAKEQTGDPRWLVAYDENLRPAQDIVLAANDIDDDINAAIAAKQSEYFKGINDLTINLAANKEYTIDAPIEAAGNIVINGNKATIDASANTGAFIQLSATPDEAIKNSNNYYQLDAEILVKDVTVTGVNSAILYDNGKQYSLRAATIDNSVIQLTTVSPVQAIRFNTGGIKDFTVKKSTIYQAGEDNITYFIQYNNGARNDRLGYADGKTTVTYENNTFYKVGTSNWGNYSGISNNSDYVVKSNLWFDCGNGQTARRILGNGRLGNNATALWDNNSYWYEDADESSASSYDTSETIVTGKPLFRKLSYAPGDFTLGVCRQIGKKVGDPRWYNVPVTTYLLQNALNKAAELLDAAQPDWQSTDAANANIAALAEAYNENTPYLASDSQEEIDEATARVEAAIAAFGNGTTGIAGVNADADNDVWYTTNGQRINKPTTKGIYIHNGKKVVVK